MPDTLQLFLYSHDHEISVSRLFDQSEGVVKSDQFVFAVESDFVTPGLFAHLDQNCQKDFP